MGKIEFIPFGGGPPIETKTMEKADVVVLPICYENAPSYGKGAGEGSFHILSASSQLECFDEEEWVDWSVLNIHTMPPLFPPNDPEEAVSQIRAMARAVMSKDKFLLSLGGDHAVSIGLISAAAKAFPGLGILQIDAHLDLRKEWNGSRYNHACVMRRVMDDLACPAVQVGIRSFSPEEALLIKSKNLKPFFAHDIVPWDDSWMDRVVAALPQNVYLTLDMDGLDPSFAPGTGTPEPGGLSYRQVTRLLKIISMEKTIVAADINELAKVPGSRVSEFTAARLAAKIIVLVNKKAALPINT